VIVRPTGRVRVVAVRVVVGVRVAVTVLGAVAVPAAAGVRGQPAARVVRVLVADVPGMACARAAGGPTVATVLTMAVALMLAVALMVVGVPLGAGVLTGAAVRMVVVALPEGVLMGADVRVVAAVLKGAGGPVLAGGLMGPGVLAVGAGRKVAVRWRRRSAGPGSPAPTAAAIPISPAAAVGAADSATILQNAGGAAARQEKWVSGRGSGVPSSVMSTFSL
jgi:hypothetical protein